MGSTFEYNSREYDVGVFSYHYKIDLREFQYAYKDLEDKFKKRAQDPLIRRAIHQDIYTKILKEGFEQGSNYLPVKSGALRDSPMGLSQRLPGTYKKSTTKITGRSSLHGSTLHTHKRAQGKIDAEGIIFDPVTISSGGEFHYAKSTPNFLPMFYLKMHRREVMDIVRTRMMEGLK